MRWIRSGWYYLRSIFRILLNFKNLPVLLPLFLNPTHSGEHQIILRQPPLRLQVRGAMDVWSVKETFLDSFYTRYGVSIQNGWQVLDIGAGIGDFSLYAAYGNPQTVVYAFEPFPDSYNLMIKNLTVNAINNVRAFQQALWSQNGRLALDLSAGEPLKITSKGPDLAGIYRDAITVQAYSLGQVLKNHENDLINLMKMDCEGAEYAILLGASCEVMSRIERIIMEYHDLDADHNHEILVFFLEKMGFRVSTHKNMVYDHIGYLFATRS